MTLKNNISHYTNILGSNLYEWQQNWESRNNAVLAGTVKINCLYDFSPDVSTQK